MVTSKSAPPYPGTINVNASAQSIMLKELQSRLRNICFKWLFHISSGLSRTYLTLCPIFFVAFLFWEASILSKLSIKRPEHADKKNTPTRYFLKVWHFKSQALWPEHASFCQAKESRGCFLFPLSFSYCVWPWSVCQRQKWA